MKEKGCLCGEKWYSLLMSETKNKTKNTLNLKVTNPKWKNSTWAHRHNLAVDLRPPTAAILSVIESLHAFGEAQAFPITEDHFTEPNFGAMLWYARQLLNLDLGDLDGGTLDAAILQIAKDNGLGENLLP